MGAQSARLMAMGITSADLSKGRLWYFLGGGLSALIGLLAILRPGLASLAIEQFLGAFFIVSGAILLGSAVMGKARKHRLLDLFSSALRLIVGVLLILKALNGLLALTVVMASIFIAEGIFGTLLPFGIAEKIRLGSGFFSTAWSRLSSAGCCSPNFPQMPPGRSACSSASTAFAWGPR